MLKLLPYRIIGFLTHPLYLWMPKTYFRIYSFYKDATDSFKSSLLGTCVQPGNSVADIGAHIGYFSRQLSALVGAKGRVYAFEPDPDNAERLKRNTTDLANVSVQESAVAAISGELQLFSSRTLNVDHRAYQAKDQARAGKKVSAVSLDDFFSADDIWVDFIKMDIQGYEEQAMTGMQSTLRKFRPAVVSEFWPWGLKQAGGSAESCLRLWQSMDYGIFFIDEPGRCLSGFSLSNIKRGQADYCDILCWPDEKPLPPTLRSLIR